MKRWTPFLLLLCGILLPLASVAEEWPSPIETTSPPAEVPELHFMTENGTPVNLSSFQGQFVILNVWATWCAPCVKEMPALDGLAELASALRIAVIPLSVDRGGAAKVREFYDRTGIKHLPLYVDTDKEVSRRLRPRGLPFTLILDRRGREIARVYGPVEWNSEEVLKVIRAAANN